MPRPVCLGLSLDFTHTHAPNVPPKEPPEDPGTAPAPAPAEAGIADPIPATSPRRGQALAPQSNPSSPISRALLITDNELASPALGSEAAAALQRRRAQQLAETEHNTTTNSVTTASGRALLIVYGDFDFALERRSCASSQPYAISMRTVRHARIPEGWLSAHLLVLICT